MLQIENLTFSYDARPVFDQFSRQLPDHCLCTANNGTGKTTLLKLISGILPCETGTIRVNDKTSYTSAILLNDRFLFDEFTVQSHLSWISEDQHLPHSELDEIIQMFAIRSWLNRMPGELSSGERQWLAIALTLCHKTDIYLLDEPMRHLDPDHKTKLAGILKKHIQPHNSVLITAHPGSEPDYQDIFSVCRLFDS